MLTTSALFMNCMQTTSRVFDNPSPPFRILAKRFAVNLFADSRHGHGMVRTVLYKCDASFFRDKLLNRYKEVDDHNQFYIEHAYYYPLIKAGFSTFKIKPSFVGISRSSGKPNHDYPVEIKEQAKYIMKSMC